MARGTVPRRVKSVLWLGEYRWASTGRAGGVFVAVAGRFGERMIPIVPVVPMLMSHGFIFVFGHLGRCGAVLSILWPPW